MTTNRHTLSYLRNLFREHGIIPKNKLGQNFLIDINLIDLVIATAEIGPEDLVVEVGSGTGGLTLRLLENSAGVVSIEVDSAFAVLVHEAVASHLAMFGSATDSKLVKPEHVRLLHCDALSNKNALNPRLLEAIDELMAVTGAKRIKLVANLPYAVAVPVLANLLLSGRPVERMVAMVQWEIAERFTASVGVKDYAALAVLMQSLADVTLVRKIGPTVFFPKPLVDSAIVMIRPNAEKAARVGDAQRFRNFLRDLYAHRRKNLRGALVARQGNTLSKQEVDAKLAEAGLDGTTRAEALDLEQHLALCRAFG